MWFKVKILIVLILAGLSQGVVFATSAINPCSGLLALVNRPNNADSPCTIPKKHIEFEAGLQNQFLSLGNQQNAPALEIRLGLPFDNELFALLPNYIHQTVAPHAGFTQTIVGIKHELVYSSDWIFSVEGMINLPDGSQAFGDAHFGSTFNGIFSYSLTPEWGITVMLGGSSLADAKQSGGQRYQSLNPYLVLAYAPTEHINFYGEIYGQTKTSSQQGSGINADIGLLYLMRTNWVFDMSMGQQISGTLGSFNQYIGAGFSYIL